MAVKSFEMKNEDIITVTGDRSGLVLKKYCEELVGNFSVMKILSKVSEIDIRENDYYIIEKTEKKTLKKERVIFVDRVKNPESFERALNICKSIEEENLYMGSLETGEIYKYDKTSAVVMASGFSKRMGQDKLFMEFQGMPMLEKILKKLSSVPFYEIILVGKDERVKNLAEKYRAKYVHNDCSYLGQSESVKLGVLASCGEGIGFFPGDQPLLTREAVLKLLWEFQKKNTITLPVVNGHRSSPVFFPLDKKSELLKLTGDTGGREVVKESSQLNKVHFEDNLLFKDVDSFEDLEEIYGKIQGDN